MNRRTFITTAVSATTIGALAGCTDEGDEGEESGEADAKTAKTTNAETKTTEAISKKTTTTAEPTTETTTTASGSIKLTHEWTEYESYGFKEHGVVGTVENTYDVGKSVEIVVKFYDSEGTQIADNLTYKDVDAGGKAEFTIGYLNDDPERVADYKIEWEAYSL